jgi:hypothetical protein
MREKAKSFDSLCDIDNASAILSGSWSPFSFSRFSILLYHHKEDPMKKGAQVAYNQG